MRYIWLLIGLVLVLPQAAQAQQSAVELHWERYDNIVQIQEDGSVRVEERQQLVIERGRVNFMTRNFQTGSAGRVTDIEVSEDGEPYREGGSGPGTFSGSDNGDEANIRVNFRDNTDAQHDLTIAYTIEETLIDRGDLADFRWNFFWSGQAPEIRSGSVEIRFPGTIAADQIAANASGVGVEQQTIENGVRWELTEPIQGQELTTQTGFPQTVLAANAQFRSGSGAPSRPDTSVTDPTLAPAGGGLNIGGVLLCAFVLVMLFIAFSAISASARRRAAGGYPQTPNYGPDPMDDPFGPQTRRRRWRGGGGGGWGGWGIPPIIITPPYGRRDDRYDNSPTDRTDDNDPWDGGGGGGGGGSSWDDNGGGGSSWGGSGGSGSSWGGFGGGGGSSWGGGGGGSGGGGGGGSGGGGGGGGSGGGGFG